MLRIKLRALYMLGKCSATKLGLYLHTLLPPISTLDKHKFQLGLVNWTFSLAIESWEIAKENR